MSLFATPELHATYPPATWVIVRSQYGSRVSWGLFTSVQAEQPLQTFATKRAAENAKVDGHYVNLYRTETRWYAGEAIPGWKSYAETQVERAAADERAAEREHTKARLVERMGTTPKQLAEWAAVVKACPVGPVYYAADEMLGLLRTGDLIDPDLLTQQEAQVLYRDLAATWGFESSVEERIHRIKYAGLDAGKTALEVLEEMEQDEREALNVA